METVPNWTDDIGWYGASTHPWDVITVNKDFAGYNNVTQKSSEATVASFGRNSSDLKDRTISDCLQPQFNGTCASTLTVGSVVDNSVVLYGQLAFVIGITSCAVAVVGILCNTFGFVVSLQRPIRRQHMAPFMVCMSVTDGLFLYTAVINTFWEQASGRPIPGFTYYCNIRSFIITASVTISGLVMACLSVQRLIALFWPHSSRVTLSLKSALVSVMAVCLMSCTICMPILFALPLDNTCTPCEGWGEYANHTFIWTMVVVQSIIPEALLLISNVLLAFGLAKSIQERRQIHPIPTQHINNGGRTRGLRLVATLAISHLLLNLPMVALRCYQLNAGGLRMFQSGQQEAVLELSFLLLITVNHSFNFLLCVGNSSTYRKVLQKLFPCCHCLTGSHTMPSSVGTGNTSKCVCLYVWYPCPCLSQTGAAWSLD